MPSQKYAVNQYLIETILAWVKSGEIAIPEIQRPFVWDAAQVRDLIDSLYQGYPIGYIIAWKNPNVRLKDGSLSEGKKILIDGQQRVTAPGAALTGLQVINKDYRKVQIRIACNPMHEKYVSRRTPAIDGSKNPALSPIPLNVWISRKIASCTPTILLIYCSASPSNPANAAASPASAASGCG